jgi:hypothetical protein
VLTEHALERIAVEVVLGIAVVACVGSPPPFTSDPEPVPSIAARWAADDGSVIVLNVVLGRATDTRRIPDLARGYRRESPQARVIVRFFAATAGEERFVIGYVPTDGGRLRTDAPPSTVLATFDFPPPSPAPTSGGP